MPHITETQTNPFWDKQHPRRQLYYLLKTNQLRKPKSIPSSRGLLFNFLTFCWLFLDNISSCCTSSTLKSILYCRLCRRNIHKWISACWLKNIIYSTYSFSSINCRDSRRPPTKHEPPWQVLTLVTCSRGGDLILNYTEQKVWSLVDSCLLIFV